MKCASVPSAYRNCILRDSVRTARNFSPARKVRSITAPSEDRRSLVRTNAPPLPGLTCWNSTILKTVPSTSMWFPFLNWLVLITVDQGSDSEQAASSGRATAVARDEDRAQEGTPRFVDVGEHRLDLLVGGAPGRDERVAQRLQRELEEGGLGRAA